MTPKPVSPDWEAIRHRYVETNAAIAEIARDAGITLNQLHYARMKGKWKRLKPRRPQPQRNRPADHATADQVPDQAGQTRSVLDSRTIKKLTRKLAAKVRRALRADSSPQSRLRLLDHTVALIALKLTQFELQFSSSIEAAGSAGATSAVDHEREVRAIATLIESLNIIKVSKQENDRETGNEDANAELARDAERSTSRSTARSALSRSQPPTARKSRKPSPATPSSAARTIARSLTFGASAAGGCVA